ncbi:dynamin-like GTPase OPA1, mitochondrial [Lycorma delicatula]|uniref:dynamin-like GTPase OPA1, mitochondrial n=1 Tax=Lycorma delicatula TaxID=130591 RepID=UPI003F511EDB
MASKVLRKVLKIRYMVLGSMIGGGFSFQKWKECLPDIAWLNDIMEENDNFGFLVGPFSYFSPDKNVVDPNEEKIKALQEKLQEMHVKYNNKLEKLEQENKKLQKQLFLQCFGSSKKQAHKSLIDMYSDVLDEISDYDSNFESQDHLPRVIVIGDQNAGKTSVLEMIVQARIFPRGTGEMMTRAPVKVTLSEGPYHIAQFRDSEYEYDLTKEKDLAKLRKQVELRMIKSVSQSETTVSNDVISMSVKGPDLQRMVLVDLPGIISTDAEVMSDDTKESVKKMSQFYMSNPNAIILCIQDCSANSGRSNVAEIVSQIDPQGKRTIFVLTKVDLVENNSADSLKIEKILSGDFLPMKAVGYFAVVAGRGRKNDTIQDIQEYEERFFKSSQIFKNISIRSQVMTKNLSRAVADCFWKMVKKTVEQQAVSFKISYANLKTEWKNNYPGLRELDRDELFEKARGEILDQVMKLREVTVRQWEEILVKKIWEKVSSYLFEHIYLVSAENHDIKMFNTSIDIKLRDWANQLLPEQSIEIGWEILQEKFSQFVVDDSQQDKSRDDIFDVLKSFVIKETINRHVWEPKAYEVLRVIQLNTVEDQTIQEKYQWDSAIKFFENSMKEELKSIDDEIYDMVGPGVKEMWLYWKYRTDDQQKNGLVKSQLDKILYSNNVSIL